MRHPSFRTADFCELLRAHDIGMVVADSAGTWPMFDEVTSDLAYVRLHGDTELYASGYSEAALDRWAEKVRGWAGDGLDVLVYFDNDAKVHAPFDAMALQERLGMTFMIVTHDQDEAMVVADRIAVMREGEIIQVGNTSRKMRFEARKVIQPRADISASAADALDTPIIVCRAVGTCVTPKDKQRVKR